MRHQHRSVLPFAQPRTGFLSKLPNARDQAKTQGSLCLSNLPSGSSVRSHGKLEGALDATGAPTNSLAGDSQPITRSASGLLHLNPSS
jgi:hypothetical protein